MAQVLAYTPRVREALKAPGRVGTEAIVFVAAVATFFALFEMGRQWTAPYQQQFKVDLSFSALPVYTLLSLGRGFAAYALSLLFTLVYGSIAAHNRRAERVMIPVLDVLQAIPVLGFLPGLVLALVALFPRHEIGLELACILMIFTGQVWNMTFSFHGSLRGIPIALREAAAMQRLSHWQTFRLLELPASMIGLVWNSMMSMAGGWFFLTVNEAFTLRDRDYRLPGIGSYMNEAINQGNTPAMVAAILAMVAMIVLVDQLFWRPIVVWSQRFKVEELSAIDAPKSWFLDLLSRSTLVRWFGALCALQLSRSRGRGSFVPRRSAGSAGPAAAALRAIVRGAALTLIAVLVAWGGYRLAALLAALPLTQHESRSDWRTVLLALFASFGRTTAAVAVGAAWALPVGILIGRSPRWSQRLQPLVQVVASFPAPMLFPLVTLLLAMLRVPFTIGCIALMLLGAQWYILFNVIAGAMAMPTDLGELARVYRMGRAQRWGRLYVPAVYPHLVTGLVTAAGGAWNATIVSEYLSIKGHAYEAFGLGSVISHATAEGNFPLLAASVTVMAGTVVLLNRLIWKRLYRVAEAHYSLNT